MLKQRRRCWRRCSPSPGLRPTPLWSCHCHTRLWERFVSTFCRMPDSCGRLFGRKLLQFVSEFSKGDSVADSVQFSSLGGHVRASVTGTGVLYSLWQGGKRDFILLFAVGFIYLFNFLLSSTEFSTSVRFPTSKTSVRTSEGPHGVSHKVLMFGFCALLSSSEHTGCMLTRCEGGGEKNKKTRRLVSAPRTEAWRRALGQQEVAVLQPVSASAWQLWLCWSFSLQFSS